MAPVQVHAWEKQGKLTALAAPAAAPFVLVNVTVAVVAVLTAVAVEVTAAFISWAAQTARPQASANKTKLVLMGDG